MFCMRGVQANKQKEEFNMAKKGSSLKAGALALAVTLGVAGVAVGTTALVKQLKEKNDTTITTPDDEKKTENQTPEQEIAGQALAMFGIL